MVKFRGYYDTMCVDLQLVRTFAESGCIMVVVSHPQQHVVLFTLAVRVFSTETYTSTFEVLQ